MDKLNDKDVEISLKNRDYIKSIDTLVSLISLVLDNDEPPEHIVWLCTMFRRYASYYRREYVTQHPLDTHGTLELALLSINEAFNAHEELSLLRANQVMVRAALDRRDLVTQVITLIEGQQEMKRMVAKIEDMDKP